MAAKISQKDKIFNFAYSIGAAIVILGALFKINHWELGPLNGALLLAIGLITEAIIFVIAAFDAPAADYEWEKAYPELLDAAPATKKAAIQQTSTDAASLSKKLDDMLKEAKIDSELMLGLKQNFEKLNVSVNALQQSNESAKGVSEELTKLQGQLASLNKVYEGMLTAMQNKG